MTDTSVTTGFHQFSLPHILALLVIATACVVVSLIYRRSYLQRFPEIRTDARITSPPRHPFALILGFFILAADIFHYCYLAANSMLDLYMLPLHLCGMSVYVVVLHCIFQSDFLGQLLYPLFLPGAACALIFPDWGYLPFFSYLSMRCFVMHGLIVLYIIMQTAAGVIQPRLSALWKPLVFLCIISPGIMVLNAKINANYMYLSGPAIGSPLELLYRLAGGNHPLYLVYFGILAIVGMSIMYLPFSIWRLAKAKKTQ